MVEKENNPIIEGMKKASMIKEAVASVALDKGQTQTFSEEDRKEPTLSEELIRLAKESSVKGFLPYSKTRDLLKEFIKRLKDGAEVNSVERGQFNSAYFDGWIDILVGDKLK